MKVLIPIYNEQNLHQSSKGVVYHKAVKGTVRRIGPEANEIRKAAKRAKQLAAAALLLMIALLTGCAQSCPNTNGEPAGRHFMRGFVRAFSEKEYFNPYTGQTGIDSRTEETIFGSRTP